MSARCERFPGVTLWHGDCGELLAKLPPVAAAVTDPPYGIGESAAKNRTRDSSAKATDYGDDDWDRVPADPAVIAWLCANARWQIIFGGNYFDLPPTSCWLVWDKENTGDFADAELAWTNLPKAVRLKRWMWNGMIRKGGEERFHLTQKPLQVMQWCLTHLPDLRGGVVLDPYMGSGTTGVAAVKAGLPFIGIEKSAKHFATACRRIEAALREPDLFVAPAPPPAVQTHLFSGGGDE
jgi:site-specific DNA-methyltransferase (adenine-specific)/modification methylase